MWYSGGKLKHYIMRHYPVQIEARIENEDISIIDKYSNIIVDFIKSIIIKYRERERYICFEIVWRLNIDFHIKMV